MINAGTMTDNQNPPMASNPYANATSAYGIRQEANLSGFEIAAKLYDGMIRFIGQAKNAHGAGNFEEMVDLVQKTNKILMALQSALNFDDGGETSIFLNDIYMESFKRLTLVLRADDPQAEFDSVRDEFN